ncbi:MAG: SHOCT domain-containing protein [Thermosipho sp. (in: Bacteria)]|nr:SHOCT domain-containing protein [Thermosipho sp. (in: thermotogales)]MCD6105713.1 SHOCT domain-containing protein [Thermosipho sp. (in: thermotogales)]
MMFFFMLGFIFIVWYLLKDENILKKLRIFQNDGDDAKSKALKILNEKFANDEISEEEYLRRKKLIEQ